MLIRELWGTDLPSYLETLKSLYVIDINESEAGDVFRSRLRNTYTYCADINKKVVSAATLELTKKYGHRGRFAGRLEDVVTHADHQRHGLGLAVVQYTIAQARIFNCYKVTCSCKEELVPFYEKCGMHRNGLEMRIDL